MTPEQKQRLKEVEENRRIWHGNMGQVTKDIDFLLSLVQSQEAGGSKLSATTAAIEWERGRTALRKGLNQSDFDSLVAKLAALIESAATSMRSACVEEMRRSLHDPSLRFSDEGIKAAVTDWTNILMKRVESVSIQEQE